jgi:hypothetical protein
MLTLMSGEGASRLQLDALPQQLRRLAGCVQATLGSLRLRGNRRLRMQSYLSTSSTGRWYAVREHHSQGDNPAGGKSPSVRCNVLKYTRGTVDGTHGSVRAGM